MKYFEETLKDFENKNEIDSPFISFFFLLEIFVFSYCRFQKLFCSVVQRKRKCTWNEQSLKKKKKIVMSYVKQLVYV